MNHGMTRGVLRLKICNSGCLCELWMLVRILPLATWCLVNFEVSWYPRWTRHQASPAFYQRSGRMKRHTWIHPEGRGFERMKWDEMSCYVIMLSCYHVMSAWVVYGLATWPCPKVEVRRYVCSSHHWPLRWPSTNDERDGPLLIPFDSGFPTHTHMYVLYVICCINFHFYTFYDFYVLCPSFHTSCQGSAWPPSFEASAAAASFWTTCDTCGIHTAKRPPSSNSTYKASPSLADCYSLRALSCQSFQCLTLQECSTLVNISEN